LITLLLGLCLGAVVGGAGGYLIGHRAQPPTAIVRPPASRAVPQPTPSRPRPVPPTPELQVPEATQVPEQTGQTGVLVREVVSGSPAANAGLKVGDIISEVDGVRLDANHKLNEVIAQHKPGDKVELSIWRRGDTQKVTVELGPRSDDQTKAYLGIRYSDLEAVPAMPSPTP
jgi:S1-C subfamily serine protease